MCWSFLIKSLTMVKLVWNPYNFNFTCKFVDPIFITFEISPKWLIFIFINVWFYLLLSF